MTARQREMPSTTAILTPRGVIPTGAGGRDGDGADLTGGGGTLKVKIWRILGEDMTEKKECGI